MNLILALLLTTLFQALTSALPACSDHITRACDETTNSFGSRRCYVDDDCYESRYCSNEVNEAGWCAGNLPTTVSDTEDTSDNSDTVTIMVFTFIFAVIILLVIFIVHRRIQKRKEGYAAQNARAPKINFPRSRTDDGDVEYATVAIDMQGRGVQGRKEMMSPQSYHTYKKWK